MSSCTDTSHTTKAAKSWQGNAKQLKQHRRNSTVSMVPSALLLAAASETMLCWSLSKGPKTMLCWKQLSNSNRNFQNTPSDWLQPFPQDHPFVSVIAHFIACYPLGLQVARWPAPSRGWLARRREGHSLANSSLHKLQERTYPAVLGVSRK